MDFEEWFNSHKYSDVPLCYGAAKDAFKAGQQGKQAEIDELQKRINDALNEIESGITGRHHVKAIIKILNGESK